VGGLKIDTAPWRVPPPRQSVYGPLRVARGSAGRRGYSRRLTRADKNPFKGSNPTGFYRNKALLNLDWRLDLYYRQPRLDDGFSTLPRLITL
jgi:hypothetical protein